MTVAKNTPALRARAKTKLKAATVANLLITAALCAGLIAIIAPTRSLAASGTRETESPTRPSESAPATPSLTPPALTPPVLSSDEASAPLPMVKPYTIALDAAVFETWVITKYGATASYSPSKENTFDLEYVRGSLGVGYFGVSLGRIEEQKASLLWRSYGQRKTFSFFTGLSYNSFTVHLGSDFLETVSGSQRANVDVAEFATLSATWGFGQRWRRPSGFVWGIDWFTISWPVVQLHEHSPFAEASSSADKRSQFTDAAKAFKRLPSVGVLKLQVGYSF
jgi:hypothetical protein